MSEKLRVPVLVQGRVARIIRCWTRFPAERYCQKLRAGGCYSAQIGGKWIRGDQVCTFVPNS
jgi:hypothetical protein